MPHDAYVKPVLASLLDSGGTAPARKIIEQVGRVLEQDFTDLDRRLLPSGTVRWENRVQFVRLRLVEKGLLANDSPRGIWSLTTEGREAAGKG